MAAAVSGDEGVGPSAVALSTVLVPTGGEGTPAGVAVAGIDEARAGRRPTRSGSFREAIPTQRYDEEGGQCTSLNALILLCCRSCKMGMVMGAVVCISIGGSGGGGAWSSQWQCNFLILALEGFRGCWEQLRGVSTQCIVWFVRSCVGRLHVPAVGFPAYRSADVEESPSLLPGTRHR
jgi:hypothetical protein